MAAAPPSPGFWKQIYVLQIKNVKTLSRNRRRVLMLVLYPVYFVVLLSILKQSSKAAQSGFWSPSIKDPYAIEYSPFDGTANGTIGFSCSDEVTASDCTSTMILFEKKTGIRSMMVSNVVSFWKKYPNKVVAGIEIQAIGTSSLYTIRLDDSDLKSVIELGAYGQTSVEEAKPYSSSLAMRAYVSSGFVFLQRSLDCSISEVLTGIGCAEEQPFLLPFPVARFKTYYSSDSSLASLVPFYMVIAFCNIIIFVVINVVIEKETKMVESLNMHGMSLMAYWASWFVTVGVVGSITCAACSVLVHAMELFPHTDTSLVFIIFFLYNMTLVPMAFVISTFFQNERIAGLVGGMGSIVVGAPTFALSSLSSVALKNSLAVLSPLAMAEALAVVMDQELDNKGVTWSNIGEQREGFSFLNGVTFLCFDMLLYLVLAWYLHQVLPHNAAVQKHPLFCCKKSPQDARVEPDQSSHNAHLIESVSSELLEMDVTKTVQVRNLGKNYKSDSGALVQALIDLSLDIYQGEVFALLGHNGAGKSSAISMLTGLTSPSSGEARILGMDMAMEMDKIRRFMGYVPQHDTLFLELTVDENLAVFAGLKGVTTQDASELLQKLGLESSRETPAKTLSGGQKRSLSVAIALIGRPKFLVLDEPTAGMDPASRRRVWDVLLEHKSERITLLTTHFLDEADVLGDRIAILAHGRLECMGSALFLKTHLGIGYHLSAVPADENFSRSAFVDFLEERVSNCTVSTPPEGQLSDGVHVTIPMSASETHGSSDGGSAMSRLLLDMDANLQQLGLATYGISLTTLEEVFVSIASGYTDISAGHVKLEKGARVRAFEESNPKPSIWKQFCLLMHSRWLVARRAVVFNIAMVLAPVVCVVFSLFLQSLVASESPITSVTPIAHEKVFGNTDLFWSGEDSTLPTCLSSLVHSHTLLRKGNSDASVENALSEQARYGDDSQSMFAGLSLSNTTSGDLEALCEAGAGFTSFRGNWTLHFNQTRPNSLPAFLALLDGVSLFGDATAFEVSAALLKDDSKQDISISDVAIALTLTYLIGLTFAPFVVTYAYEVVKDREDGRQQQLTILGTHPVAIWGSAVILDFVRWCLPFFLVFCVIAAYQSDMLLSHGALPALTLVVVTVGFQTILGAYCLGHFVETTETISTTLSPIIVLATMLLYTVVWTALVGTVGFSQELAPYALTLTMLGGLVLPPFLIMSAFSFVIHLSAYGLEYPEPSAYLAWSTSCPYSNNDVCFGVLPVLSSALVSILLSMLFLSGIAYKLSRIFTKKEDNASANQEVSENIPEVEDEKKRVMWSASSREPSVVSPIAKSREHRDSNEQLLLDEEMAVNGDTVQIKGLRKVFKGETQKVAVEGLFLGIKRGECFGLLGHNGAGKTSLISMLTCALDVSSGDALVNGYSVITHKEEVLQNTGFCPQFGGVWPTMTLREHLELYLGLRGFDTEANQIQLLADEIETALAVSEHSRKLVKELSGGSRRKLSAALALIGGPSIVYLDEPSTGVDAATRRYLWEFIAGNQAGRATVLTTHAMEEAEVLAGRIGIMVAGSLRALGTPQQLKSKYGSQWQLDIKLSQHSQRISTAQDGDASGGHYNSQQPIIDFLSQQIHGSLLEESFADSMRFMLPANSVVNSSHGLGYTFNLIETNKPTLGIHEFSLSQSTLENVFLKVAKEDEEKD